MPDFARSKPEMVRSVVVLPAPLPPMSVTIAPCSILNEMPAERGDGAVGNVEIGNGKHG